MMDESIDVVTLYVITSGRVLTQWLYHLFKDEGVGTWFKFSGWKAMSLLKSVMHQVSLFGVHISIMFTVKTNSLPGPEDHGGKTEFSHELLPWRGNGLKKFPFIFLQKGGFHHPEN